MDIDLRYMKFEVSSFEELSTLVVIWKDMIASIFKQTPIDSKEPTRLDHYGTVQVTVHLEEKPSREVFLVFIAPRSLVEQFFTTLKGLGVDFTCEEVDEDESLISCRLISPVPKH